MTRTPYLVLVRPNGSRAYVLCPDGPARSRFLAHFAEHGGGRFGWPEEAVEVIPVDVIERRKGEAA